MKLSVAIADTNAAPSAFVVWRGFEESIRKAKAAGYNGVELALKTAKEFDAAAVRRALDQNDMDVSCISTGQVFAALGQYLTNVDHDARMAAVDTLCGLCDLAKDFGGMVNIGRARGYYVDDRSREEIEGLFLDSLSRIAERADKNGVTVVIEPVNRYEINFINNVEECAALLRRVDASNVGVMPDVFHMNIEDAKIGDALRAHGDLVKYVHLADSNRYAPGNAHMNFDEIFDALYDIRYDGWVTVEILPKPSPDEAAQASADFLIPYIRRHNERLR